MSLLEWFTGSRGRNPNGVFRRDLQKLGGNVKHDSIKRLYTGGITVLELHTLGGEKTNSETGRESRTTRHKRSSNVATSQQFLINDFSQVRVESPGSRTTLKVMGGIKPAGLFMGMSFAQNGRPFRPIPISPENSRQINRTHTCLAAVSTPFCTYIRRLLFHPQIVTRRVTSTGLFRFGGDRLYCCVPTLNRKLLSVAYGV